jgi:hypothetical protein
MEPLQSERTVSSETRAIFNPMAIFRANSTSAATHLQQTQVYEDSEFSDEEDVLDDDSSSESEPEQDTEKEDPSAEDQIHEQMNELLYCLRSSIEKLMNTPCALENPHQLMLNWTDTSDEYCHDFIFETAKTKLHDPYGEVRVCLDKYSWTSNVHGMTQVTKVEVRLRPISCTHWKKYFKHDPPHFIIDVHHGYQNKALLDLRDVERIWDELLRPLADAQMGLN